jgi:hypothetical protein
MDEEYLARLTRDNVQLLIDAVYALPMEVRQSPSTALGNYTLSLIIKISLATRAPNHLTPPSGHHRRRRHPPARRHHPPSPLAARPQAQAPHSLAEVCGGEGSNCPRLKFARSCAARHAACLQGINKKKKDKMEWDAESKTWRPRWGKHLALNHTKTKP